MDTQAIHDRAADGYARARVAEVVPAGQGGCGMRCTGAWHPENSEKAPGGPSRNESSEGSEVIQPRVKGVQVSGARGRRYRTNAGGWSRGAGGRRPHHFGVIVRRGEENRRDTIASKLGG
eukprot:scaffold1130_cov74-Phaeocystis_antarctica.AAC.5